MADKAAFVSSLWPHAVAASQRTGVDPRIIIAQAANESAWGRSAPGNNYFGIKGPGQTFGTHEVVNGQSVATTDSFRAYKDPADSVAGYADFITKNPRYGGLREAKGLEAQAQALQASGYATDPNYGSKVLSIAQGIGEDGSIGGGSGADTLTGGTQQPSPSPAPTQTPTAPAAPAEPPSLSSQFLTGGPGALFGKPQEDWNMGDALIGAGVAALSRDKPQAAAALAAMYKTNKENKKSKSLQMTGVDKETGQAIIFDPSTGGFKSVQAMPGRPKEPDEPDAKVIDSFTKNNRSVQDASDIADATHNVREAIATGKLKMGAMSNIEDMMKNYSGNSDEGSRVRSSLERLKMAMVAAEQANQAGVQTESDALRYLQKSWSTASNYDNKTALENLDELHKRARNDVANYASSNKQLITKYGPKLDSGSDADGPVQYSKKYDDTINNLKQRELDYAPKRDTFYKNQQAPASSGEGGLLSEFDKRFKKK